jgi:hypothetical protein
MAGRTDHASGPNGARQNLPPIQIKKRDVVFNSNYDDDGVESLVDLHVGDDTSGEYEKIYDQYANDPEFLKSELERAKQVRAE